MLRHHEIDGIHLHLSQPHEAQGEWIGQGEVLRQLLACWIVVAIVTIMTLGLLVIGGDARYLGVFWLIIVGLIWAGYALSSRRQRQQTSRLRALAARWLSAGPPVSGERGVRAGVPVRNATTD